MSSHSENDQIGAWKVKKTESKKQSLEIVRDNTFHRFGSDEILYNKLSNSIDISFIQYGPLLHRQDIEDGNSITRIKNILTEVARARISFGPMMNFILNFLRKEIARGTIDKDKLLKEINSFEARED